MKIMSERFKKQETTDGATMVAEYQKDSDITVANVITGELSGTTVVNGYVAELTKEEVPNKN